ncbi:MAG: response regulator, partial [Myxococcota bacterium]
LPGASGIEVARAMACDSALHAVPRLLLASFGQIPSEDELDQLGVHACVTTPVRRGRLREMVKAILGDPRSSVNITRDLSRPIFLPEALQPNLRVLVAEDNPVNQQVVVHQLGQLGYKPDFVADGREATLAARTVPYDLILMDGHMPAVDGFAAARQIRDAESDGHRAVIVAMTADTTQQARERAVAADMDDFVTKPVQLEQLQALFAVWFPARPADELADIPTMQRGVPSVLLDELKTAPASSRPDSLRDQRVREALGTAATWSSGDDSARAASLALADDPELRAAVAVEFARDTPRQVERVRAALRASDLAALGFAAHALKGSSLAAGAGELAALCAEVEVRALAGDREEAEGLATAIPGLAAIAVREVSGDGERKE